MPDLTLLQLIVQLLALGLDWTQSAAFTPAQWQAVGAIVQPLIDVERAHVAALHARQMGGG